MNVELNPEAVQFVQGLVAAGQFKSADEAVAEGLRLLMRQQQLRAEIQKGIDELDAGQGIEGEVVFGELRERARKLMDKIKGQEPNWQTGEHGCWPTSPIWLLTLFLLLTARASRRMCSSTWLAT